MSRAESKLEREKNTVSSMIRLYCLKKHGIKNDLCPDCRKLYDYALRQIDSCPFMETKTFCSVCRVHCYKGDMREKIREVMSFSGPRMIFRYPVLAVRHLMESRKNDWRKR